MINLLKHLIIYSIGLLLLGACANRPVWKDETRNKIKAEVDAPTTTKSLAKTGVPRNISKALINALGTSIPNTIETPKAQTFNISVNQVEAKEMYLNLVKDTAFSVVVDDSVRGSVTLSLKNVTLLEVFQYAQEVYGFNFDKRNSNYFVYGDILQTKIFHIDYLNMIREGVSHSEVTSGGIKGGSSGAGVSIDSKNSVKFWKNLTESLSVLIGDEDGKKVVVNQHSGDILIKAWASEVRVIKKFLANMQGNITRQVILEAKLLEVELSDGYETGINWATLVSKGSSKLSSTKTGGGTSIVGNSKVDVINDPLGSIGASAFGGVFSVALQTANFGLFIEAIRTQGDVHILSSPRIAVINNQKAVIKVGGEEFFVTGIKPGRSRNDLSGTVQETTPTVEIEPFFSGISLDVTPQIDSDENIILHLHPTVSEVVQRSKSFVINGKGFELPLAASSVRETDTVVRARSGQIIVVGGLMKETTRNEESSVPFLGDLPFIGSLFRHKKVVRIKKELVVLVKPTIVSTQKDWNNQMDINAKRFSRLMKP